MNAPPRTLWSAFFLHFPFFWYINSLTALVFGLSSFTMPSSKKQIVFPPSSNEEETLSTDSNWSKGSSFLNISLTSSEDEEAKETHSRIKRRRKAKNDDSSSEFVVAAVRIDFPKTRSGRIPPDSIRFLNAVKKPAQVHGKKRKKTKK